MINQMTDPLLSVRDLKLQFSKERSLMDTMLRRQPVTIRALNGVTFDVVRGETLGIVGESGCGKSTLARAIVRLVRANGGEIRYAGLDVRTLRGEELRAYHRRVQMVFQDPYSSLNPRMTVRQTLAEALQVHRMCVQSEISNRISELLELVRLTADSADKYPHEFSGGQRQRIGIARALSVQPECLIADELVSALDVSVQAQVVNLLLELQERLGLTILFVAHDLRLVRHISHRVAVIYLGSIVEIGPSQSLFSSPKHPYSRALLAAAPSLNPDRKTNVPAISGELPSPLNIPSGCAFHVRCPFVTDICRRDKPQLRPMSSGGSVACHHAETITTEPPSGTKR